MKLMIIFIFIFNHELLRIKVKVQTIKTIGDSGFGSIFKATNRKVGEVVAIVKIKQKYTN